MGGTCCSFLGWWLLLVGLFGGLDFALIVWLVWGAVVLVLLLAG